MSWSSWIVIVLSSLLIVSIGCGGSGVTTPGPTPTPVPNSVTITFAAPTPVAFAQKIGAGNWTAASPSGGQLVVQLPSGTTQYGVAFVCQSVRSGTAVDQQFMIQADIKDGNTYTLQQCLPDLSLPLPTASFTGSFDATAIAGASQVEISVDNFSSNLVAATPTGSFNITTAQVGITDAFAVAYDSSHTLLGMKIVRSQIIPGVANGGNPITLAASDAVTTSMPISLANIPAGFPQVFGIHFPSYVTANGGYAIATGFNGFIPTGYSVVPATQAQPSDYYLVDMLAAGGNQQVTTSQRLKTAAPVTLTLPNPWTAMPPTPARFPTFTFDYTGFTGQPAIAYTAGLSWTQGGVAFGVSVTATANSQNGATTLTFPDLTPLPGFFPMAPSGATISWGASTSGGTAPVFARPTAVPQTLSNVSDQGTYTQP
jgi:hypothetical protein